MNRVSVMLQVTRPRDFVPEVRSENPTGDPDRFICHPGSRFRRFWTRTLFSRTQICRASAQGVGSMSVEKRDVTFKSGETFAAAWLFLPETAAVGARVPAIAMAHGLGAVKEM